MASSDRSDGQRQLAGLFDGAPGIEFGGLVGIADDMNRQSGRDAAHSGFQFAHRFLPGAQDHGVERQGGVLAVGRAVVQAFIARCAGAWRR